MHFPIVLALFSFSWNIKCFPFPFFPPLKIRLCFFLWLISMYSSYRISALICNASLWLFFLKVCSHRAVHYKSLFSVATCLLQTSPPRSQLGQWLCHPTSHPQDRAMGLPHVLCSVQGHGRPRHRSPSSRRSAEQGVPSSGRVCPLCHRSEH